MVTDNPLASYTTDDRSFRCDGRFVSDPFLTWTAPRRWHGGHLRASTFVLASHIDDLVSNDPERGVPCQSLLAVLLPREDAIEGNAALKALARLGLRVAPSAAADLAAYFGVFPHYQSPLPTELCAPGALKFL